MISKATFNKRNRTRIKADNKITFDVFTVVRHTRSGDKRIGIYDNQEIAMDRAESEADSAARDYGYGSASVFPSRLEYTGPAIKSKSNGKK